MACYLVAVTGMAVGIQEHASAQGVGSSLGSFFPVPIVGSFEPVTTFEKFCGPILPKCGIGNTFRSEVGVGYNFIDTCSAQLKGGGLELDLRTFAVLDQAPPNAEISADLRLWRLGFRTIYSYFDNRSHNSTLGRLEWSGVRFGVDLDALHLEWLTFGASVDYYLIDPRFNGAFFTKVASKQVTLPKGKVVQANIIDDLNRIDVVGSKPLTWGLYFRYMPPAIFGMPVHFDAYFNAPLAGSRLGSYGLLLSFRPQIYRFDLACKLGWERNMLKFSGFATPAGATALQPGNYELDMNWERYKLEIAAYF